MPWLLWISAGVILLVAELYFTRVFALLSFGAGALLAGVLGAMGILNPPAQWLCFGLLSTVLLVCVRDRTRGSPLPKFVGAEPQHVIGQVARPLQNLPAFGSGMAKLGGIIWKAYNAGHLEIARGQRCRVIKVKGTILWILPE
jgi:membrane protein implicated in regulation of membrane protease activity